MRNDYGPRSDFSDKLHGQKYRQERETFREAMTRVALALADNDEHFQEFRTILLHQRFMPAGRIQAAIGSSKRITPYNCYVSGTFEDSYVDGVGSIMNRAKEAALTMRLGGGIGYDFSPLRPRGTLIKKLGSRSSGPISFMEIFDAVCRATSSAGHRRGAQMGVMRIDHPDVEEFIRVKHDLKSLRGFNLSLGVTDEFMQAVVAGNSFDLRFEGQVYNTVDARALWDTVMRSTYDYADPGVLFIDTINRRNNLYYCEQIAATNPCGEQPLPPYGACLLGSFNLVSYLIPRGTGWAFDWVQFFADIPGVVRAMDNVVDRAIYPLYEQEKEAHSKRRMGLGVTGVANAIEALGFPYGTLGFITNLEIIMRGLRDEAYRASAQLAAEKGSFPLYKRDLYTQGEFFQTLSEDVQEEIYNKGIRNSHLISIAPTGTISLCADNISSGIEPVFDYKVERVLIEFDGPKRYQLEDYGVKYLNVKGKTTEECSVSDHLRVLVAASKYVDSAVSKTCNVPQDVNYEMFKNIYMTAWSNGAKGCTTYRKGGMLEGILHSVTEEDSVQKEEPEAAIEPGLVCTIDPVTGLQQCD